MDDKPEFDVEQFVLVAAWMFCLLFITWWWGNV